MQRDFFHPRLFIFASKTKKIKRIMGAGKWIGGILGFMTMGTTGSFGRICLRLIAGWKQRLFWQYIRKRTGGSRKL